MTGVRSILLLSTGALSALGAAACSFDDPNPNELADGAPPVTAPAIALDTQSVLSAIANQAYATSPDFIQASVAYPSAKDPADIVEWVSADAAAAYAKISPSPDAAAPNVALPTGAVLVRAVYPLPDAGLDGALQAVTVLVKGPPSTDPSLGDWWFGVLNPDGTPQLLPDGGPEVGPLTTECHGCHNTRGPGVDYLFGVPDYARTSSF